MDEVAAQLDAADSRKVAEEFDRILNEFNGTEKGIYSPKDIDSKLAEYVARFDRLKFLFLEQESKERFLRGILSSNCDFNQDDIFNVIQKEKKLNVEIESNENRIEELSNKIKEIISENIEKEAIAGKLKAEVFKLNDELKELNKVKDELFNDLNELKQLNPNIEKLEQVIQDNADILKENDIVIDKAGLSRLNGKNAELQKKINELIKQKNEKMERLKVRDELVRKREENETKIKEILSSSTIELKNVDLLIKIWGNFAKISSIKCSESGNGDEQVLEMIYKDSPLRIVLTKEAKIKSIEYSKHDKENKEEEEKLINFLNLQKSPLNSLFERI